MNIKFDIDNQMIKRIKYFHLELLYIIYVLFLFVYRWEVTNNDTPKPSQ